MKLNFFAPQAKKKRINVQVQEEKVEKDYIFINDNGTIESTNKVEELVIPLESSTFVHYVKQNQNSEDDESDEEVKKDDKMDLEYSGYGLIMSNEKPAAEEEETNEEVVLPLILRNRPKELSGMMDETERFRKDVDMRPPEATLDVYDRVPVEKFGEALLRGMGWSEGQAIGKNHTTPAEVVKFPRRPARLGIGAKPAPEFFIGVKVRVVGGEYRGQIAKITAMVLFDSHTELKPKTKKDKAKAELKYSGKEILILLKHMKKLRNQEDDLPPTSKRKKDKDRKKDKSGDKDKKHKKRRHN